MVCSCFLLLGTNGSCLLLQTIPVVQSRTTSATTVTCDEIGINDFLKIIQEQWVQEQDVGADI